MSEFILFEVGGCVRDELMGLSSKDIDYTVVGPESFNEMVETLRRMGFVIFKEDAPHFTARAHFPRDWEFAGRNVGDMTADFVLARNESGYSDGRHPDKVEVGTLYDDLARRDFTVNAIAKDEFGILIDPFGGQADLKARRLVAVGGAERSFSDDALRALRALRFTLTKGLAPDADILDALDSTWLPDKVRAISFERRMEELDKMFKFDTLTTLTIIETLTRPLRAAMFDGFHLTTTNKTRGRK